MLAAGIAAEDGMTRTGAPRSTATRAAIGNRKRRSAEYGAEVADAGSEDVTGLAGSKDPALHSSFRPAGSEDPAFHPFLEARVFRPGPSVTANGCMPTPRVSNES